MLPLFTEQGNFFENGPKFQIQAGWSTYFDRKKNTLQARHKGVVCARKRPTAEFITCWLLNVQKFDSGLNEEAVNFLPHPRQSREEPRGPFCTILIYHFGPPVARTWIRSRSSGQPQLGLNFPQSIK